MDNKKRCVIGIDIGGTNFRIGTVDTDRHVYGFEKVPVKSVFKTDEPLKDLAGFLKNYIATSLPELNITAVSIGFPATVNRERTVVLQAPNVRYMENLPVVEYLSEALKLPIYIERDVSMALYYDMAKYGIPNEGIIAGIYFGTGIGNAICMDGKLLAGKNGTAGELGHIPVFGCKETCGCGNIGCMEPIGGGRYLTHLCNTIYSKTRIDDIFAIHGKERQLMDYVDRIAITICTEINILDPDYILIGGGVLAMDSFPLDLLKARIMEHTRKPEPAASLNLFFTEDVPEKCVIGAAVYAMEKQNSN